MNYDYITEQRQLSDFCAHLQGAPWIAFDTEFVAEYSYRPELCLIQVATADRLAVIDPQAPLRQESFWEALVAGDQRTIVHAGREEFRFCRRFAGDVPRNWFDVQLAAGMVGLEFPASYGKLLWKLLGEQLAKHETRTDWRRRPLSQSQIEYALDDVTHLAALCERLENRLQELHRMGWFIEEIRQWQQQVDATDSRERWRRVAGISNLSPKALTIVRELARWRDEEAARRDCPPKRVLRDDLLVELARRGKADNRQIRAVRGLQRPDLKRHMPEIAECIRRALDAEPASLPRSNRRDYPPQFNMLGQYLGAALASICHAQSIAVGLVGSVQDVRDLIAHHLGYLPEEAPLPQLTEGWRANVVGQQIEQLLRGELAMRISDPHAAAPFSFDDIRPADPS